MNDINEYENSRGLLIDNLTEYLPGPILDSIEKLNTFIADPFVMTKETGDFFNVYKDNKSCQRLVDFWGL